MMISSGLTRAERLTIWAIIGVVVVYLVAAYVNMVVAGFMNAQVRARISRALAEERQIAVALESFFLDNGCYPLSVDASRTDAALMKDMFGNLTSAHIENASGSSIKRIYMTTPIAYIAQVPSDPHRGRGNEYGYLYMSDGSSYYAIVSYGPDGVPDIAPDTDKFRLAQLIYAPSNGTYSRGDIITIGP